MTRTILLLSAFTFLAAGARAETVHVYAAGAGR